MKKVENHCQKAMLRLERLEARRKERQKIKITSTIQEHGDVAMDLYLILKLLTCRIYTYFHLGVT